MKTQALILIALVALGACKKREHASAPGGPPAVAGSWAGTGTDDAIGFYNVSMDLSQDENTAAGTFTMAGPVANVTGSVSLTFNGGALQGLQLTRESWTVTNPSHASRLCAATLTVRTDARMAADSLSFHYTMTDCQGGTWTGGASLSKRAGV